MSVYFFLYSKIHLAVNGQWFLSNCLSPGKETKTFMKNSYNRSYFWLNRITVCFCTTFACKLTYYLVYVRWEFIFILYSTEKRENYKVTLSPQGREKYKCKNWICAFRFVVFQTGQGRRWADPQFVVVVVEVIFCHANIIYCYANFCPLVFNSWLEHYRDESHSKQHIETREEKRKMIQ